MSEILDQLNNDYKKYRGKCKEMSEKLVAENTNLTLVRGHYFCPIWNKDEPHWWAKDSNGLIVDVTANQFPSKGHGIYTEFSGYCECSQCGKEIAEKDLNKEYCHGNYTLCSYKCFGKFVGVF